MKLVSLVKGNDRKENIRRALELILKDLDVVRNKRNILIKPNLTAIANPVANTHPDAVLAVIEFLLEHFPSLKDSRIVIGEGSGSAHFCRKSTMEVLKKFNYHKICEKYSNVELQIFDDAKDFDEISIVTVTGPSKIRVARENFDFKISVAVPKTHNYGIATFGIKNMMGLIKQEDKVLVHGLRSDIDCQIKTLFDKIPPSLISKARRTLPNKIMNALFFLYPPYRKSIKLIHNNLFQFAKTAMPDLVVIDGFIGMEGDGPIDGTPVNLKAAIASTDALKADGIGARIIGFDPSDIGYLFYLQQAGFGDYSTEGLVGDKIEDVQLKFKPHGTYNIQKRWKD